MRAQVVRVQREEGQTGLFYATSPDLRGLLVAEPTLEELERAIPQAIVDLYKATGVDVVVTRVDEGPDRMKAWVAVPVELARMVLKEQSAA